MALYLPCTSPISRLYRPYTAPDLACLRMAVYMRGCVNLVRVKTRVRVRGRGRGRDRGRGRVRVRV